MLSRSSFSAFQLRRLQNPGGGTEPAPNRCYSERGRGWGTCLRHPTCGPSLGCATTMNFLTFMATALLILYASRPLGSRKQSSGSRSASARSAASSGRSPAAPLTRRIGAAKLIALAAVVAPGASRSRPCRGPNGCGREPGRCRVRRRVRRHVLRHPEQPSLQAAVTADDMRSPSRARELHQLRHPADRRRCRRSAWDPDRGPGDTADLVGRRGARGAMAIGSPSSGRDSSRTCSPGLTGGPGT